MKNSISIVIVFLLAIGCSSKKNEAERGNAVSGSFTLFTDKNNYAIVSVLRESFLSIYPEIEMVIDTGNGADLIDKIASKKVQAAVTSRSVTSQDSLALASRNIFYHQFHFATDAIALIANKADSNAMQQLGYATTLMSECGGDSIKFTVCTGDPGSDINYILPKLVPGAATCMPKWINAGNTDGILKMVTTKRGYVGLVPWSLMSDSGDPEVRKLRDSVMIVKLPAVTDATKRVWPVQTEIATGEYPLVQKLYLLTSEPYSGPATGFAAYVASAEGQRIIRLYGIQPGKMPTREVVITN